MKSLTLSVLALTVTVPLACSHENKETQAPATGADAQAFDKRGDLGQDQPGNAPLGAVGTTSGDNNVGGTNTSGGSGGSMTSGGTGATGGSTTRGGSGTGGTSP